MCCFTSWGLPCVLLARGDQHVMRLLCLPFGQLAFFLQHSINMLRFAIVPAFYFNLCVCDDWLNVREGERAESCALPGVPNTQTDGQKFRDQNGDPFVF